MYPRAFAYARPHTVDEALDLLAEHGSDAGVLAGGMSLVPQLKYRQRGPAVVVDIGGLRDLAGLTLDAGVLRIGALTRHAEAAQWCGHAGLAMVAELAGRIGDPQVRNMGTVGGSLAAVEPTGDWGAALLAVRGEVVARAGAGQRTIAADDLFVATHTSSLRPDELLTEVGVPVPGGRFGTAQAKFEQRAGAALMSCAVCLELDPDTDQVLAAGVAAVGLAGHPVRLDAVEQAVHGQWFDEALLDEVAAIVRGRDPDYRRSVLGRLVRDALRDAAARARATDDGEEAG
ncbi:MAG: xanthine dehydrogenase family protein subunit M [Streptosporangiales bacterium]|nr:xanthine dehydrogenase family protein subunit M [Streptosporangiales bacterium]